MTAIRLVYPKPGYMLTDAHLEVTLDGQPFYAGSFLEGFDRSVPIGPGPHKLETRLGVGPVPAKGAKGTLQRFAYADLQSFARTRSYEITIAEGQTLTATLRYSRFWGNFKGRLDLEVTESAPYR